MGENTLPKEIALCFLYGKCRAMLIELKHQKLIVFQIARDCAVECYKLTRSFPDIERFGITQQIRRAAVSVFLNIAEGAARKTTKERIRFFEIARASLIEVDAALEISFHLDYFNEVSNSSISSLMNHCFALLSNLIKQSESSA